MGTLRVLTTQILLLQRLVINTLHYVLLLIVAGYLLFATSHVHDLVGGAEGTVPTQTATRLRYRV